MKFLVILFTLIVYTQTFSEEKVFSVKTVTNLYMQPDASSPVIYPVDHAKELIKKKNKEIGSMSLMKKQDSSAGF